MGTRWCLAGLLLITLDPVSWYAQSGTDTGSIYGVVTDTTGSVIPGATVTVVNESTGLSRETPTGHNGHYELTQVRVGRYTVTVEIDGFKTHRSENVAVAVTEATRRDVVLQVGNVARDSRGHR